MSAKRIIAFLLLTASLFTLTACGCAKKEDKTEPTATPLVEQTAEPTADATETSAPTKAPETNETSKKHSQPAPVPPSSNKEVVSDENAPEKIYWLMTGENNLTYHIENCAEIKDKGAQEVTWEMVKTIGLRQCPVCNPPQYEGYVEN